MRPPRSLKARAFQWLAQREQSRVELRRKLMAHARAEDAARAAADVVTDAGTSTDAATDAAADFSASERGGSADIAPVDPAAGGGLPWPSPGASVVPGKAPSEPPRAAERVEALLDWLEANQYLSSARFAESRVHARSARFGNLRIRQELKQHQVELSPAAAEALRSSELQRARAVRDRKFGPIRPTLAADRAKQARFLAARGFSPDVIGRVFRARADDLPGED